MRPARRSVISLTPLVDVVFILLMFFMLTTAFVDFREMRLARPNPAEAQSKPPPVEHLLLNGQGVLLRLPGREPFEWGHATGRSTPMILHSEAQVPVQVIVDHLLQLEASGRKVNLGALGEVGGDE